MTYAGGIRSAIKLSESGKSPGPDGYSSRFDKTFTDSIAPLFHRAFSLDVTSKHIKAVLFM